MSRLFVDAIFLGLTRPPLFFGVSYSYALLNGMICMVYYINYTDFKAFLFMIGIHMVGYVICFKEPLLIELLIMKGSKCSICKNKLYHGANSYDVY